MTMYEYPSILNGEGMWIKLMTKEQIYERMTVQFVTPDPEIPCEFDDGKPCDLLYEKVCKARMRISERTGIDFEDRDLLAMVEGLEEIGKVLAMKMFDYGIKSGVQM